MVGQVDCGMVEALVGLGIYAPFFWRRSYDGVA